MPDMNTIGLDQTWNKHKINNYNTVLTSVKMEGSLVKVLQKCYAGLDLTQYNVQLNNAQTNALNVHFYDWNR